MVGDGEETGCSRRSWLTLFEAFSVYFSNWVDEFPSTYQSELIDEDSESVAKI